jgi:peptidoglycan/LPS O-acetylase OafA/YrhL
MLYGHFAVAVFIVLSGFSLAVAPARAGWRINDTKRYFYKRAWRILPTYWPALVFSLAIAWFITNQPGEGTPGLKSVVINGLLVQDIFGAATPNGAFWSIPIEVQPYLVFPLLIIITRRYGAWTMTSIVAGLVILVDLLSSHSSAVHALLRFTPQLAALFALGAAAAGVVRVTGKRASALVWLPWLALATTVPVIGLIVARGPVWSLDHLFWLDLAFAGIAAGYPRSFVAFLDTRPIRGLGSISYTLYCTHAPVVVAWYYLVIGPAVGHGDKAFLLSMVTSVPLAIIVARLFAAVFELPFTRAKSWPVLRERIRARAGQKWFGIGLRDRDLAVAEV